MTVAEERKILDRRITLELERLNRAKRIQLARQSFYEFCRIQLPAFYMDHRGYLQSICDTLQAFVEDRLLRPDGRPVRNLILNVAPRHGKTLTSDLLCRWMFGHDPTIPIIRACYNENLSGRSARTVRDGICELKADPSAIIYSDIFPGTQIKKGDAGQQMWSLEGQHFSFLATSPGATLTGFGARLGVIDDIVKNAEEAFNPRVLDEEWNWYCFVEDTEITMQTGAKLIKDIGVGDIVLTYNHTKCIMEHKRVCRIDSKPATVYALRFSNGRDIKCTGNHKFFTNYGYLSIEEILQDMRRSVAPGEDLLFPFMQIEGLRPTKSFDKLSKLPSTDTDGTTEPSSSILFFGLSIDLQNERVSYETPNVVENPRGREREVQEVPKVQRYTETACPSYRPQHNEQRTGESHCSMRIVPYTVSQLTQLPENDIQRVYDIEVEDNHNFFANGMLVHNCDTWLSRLEAGAKQLIIMQRWATGDLCGRLLAWRPQDWHLITYPVCNDKGEMLAPDILSKEDYEVRKEVTDPVIFASIYHQEPFDVQGSLYGEFKTYQYGSLPKFESIAAYFDTADEGSDYLAGGVFGLYQNQAYMIEVLYTQASMESTEPMAAELLSDREVNTVMIESNNGGRGFARNVERLLREAGNHKTEVRWFHQSENKRARILTNATVVTNSIIMPHDWRTRWPAFASALRIQKEGKWAHDDAPDVLTGVTEHFLGQTFTISF